MNIGCPTMNPRFINESKIQQWIQDSSMNPRFINESKIHMSNNEYRDVQQWIQDPSMNSLMNIQSFEGQFFEGQSRQIRVLKLAVGARPFLKHTSPCLKQDDKNEHQSYTHDGI